MLSLGSEIGNQQWSCKSGSLHTMDTEGFFVKTIFHICSLFLLSCTPLLSNSCNIYLGNAIPLLHRPPPACSLWVHLPLSSKPESRLTQDPARKLSKT
jgi:hypothetical protein